MSIKTPVTVTPSTISHLCGENIDKPVRCLYQTTIPLSVPLCVATDKIGFIFCEKIAQDKQSFVESVIKNFESNCYNFSVRAASTEAIELEKMEIDTAETTSNSDAVLTDKNAIISINLTEVHFPSTKSPDFSIRCRTSEGLSKLDNPQALWQLCRYLLNQTYPNLKEGSDFFVKSVEQNIANDVSNISVDFVNVDRKVIVNDNAVTIDMVAFLSDENIERLEKEEEEIYGKES